MNSWTDGASNALQSATALLLASLVFLSACGGSSDSNAPSTPAADGAGQTDITQDGDTVPAAATVVLAATDDDDVMGRQLTWEQIEGPPAYPVATDGAQLTFIAPGVTQATRITFSATIDDIANNDTAAPAGNTASTPTPAPPLTLSIDVMPRAPVQQATAPSPTVFANGRLSKYDNHQRDAAGIPQLSIDGETHYYPVLVAHWANDLYYQLEIGDLSTQQRADYRQAFITAATWLRDNCVYTDYGFCSFRSFFPQPGHNVDQDWPSAMAQGLSLPALLGAHFLTGDDSFATVAQDALAGFQYPTTLKGVQAPLGDGVFYEEYGAVDSPSHVMNGFIFALSGIDRYRSVHRESLVDEVFDRGVDALLSNLDAYDAGFTSRYDLTPSQRFASTKTGPDAYHELHVFQLGWLYQVTGRAEFRDMAHRFLQQDMGGLASVAQFAERSKEIVDVEASHTIEPESFGTDRLTDANWTYLKYWSSNRFPSTLTLTLNADVLDAAVLNNLVLVSLDEMDFPTAIDVFSIADDGTETLIVAGLSRSTHEHRSYFQDLDGYSALVVNFALDAPVTGRRLRLSIAGAPNGEYTRLREIDVHYPRDKLLQDILEFYTTSNRQ